MAKKKKKENQDNTLARNKKAFFEYEIIEKFETGIVLQGSEVKSMKAGKVSIKESYGKFVGNELFIVGMNVAEYKNANIFNHEALRERKLLLHKRELKKLQQKSDIAGYSIIPLAIYKKKHLIKVQIGLGRGKREYDKRQTLKDRDGKREVARMTKHFNQKNG